MRATTIVMLLLPLLAGCSASSESYPESDASYAEVNSEVGCAAGFESERKLDIFNSKHRNRWMTWPGTVMRTSEDHVVLDIDDNGAADLAVDFADRRSGRSLKGGDRLTVRFLMKVEGGCFRPFSGKKAIIVGRGEPGPR